MMFSKNYGEIVGLIIVSNERRELCYAMLRGVGDVEQLATETGLTSDDAKRNLAGLEAAGALKSYAKGNRILYKFTAEGEEAVRDALQPIGPFKPRDG